ncbi:hypothetical protein VNO78_18440 [Psophocarpus tetragonolobus]|uniref:Uncharacterized protein n=1 Tax=Psophocarpus tetragonolobus TaxID=3891 RepID=A0AAN9XM19_PSOTE
MWVELSQVELLELSTNRTKGCKAVKGECLGGKCCDSFQPRRGRRQAPIRMEREGQGTSSKKVANGRIDTQKGPHGDSVEHTNLVVAVACKMDDWD